VTEFGRKVFEDLKAHGPSTMEEIANRLGKRVGSIQSAIRWLTSAGEVIYGSDGKWHANFYPQIAPLHNYVLINDETGVVTRRTTLAEAQRQKDKRGDAWKIFWIEEVKF
jgi:hypothetical protein